MKYAAHYIITGAGQVLRKGIVEIDPAGQVLRVTSNENGLSEQAGMEFHSGVICPAFPNLLQIFSERELFEKLPQLNRYRKFLPPDQQNPKVIFNWIKNIQLNDETAELSDLIDLFCTEGWRIVQQPDLGTIETGKRPGLVLLYVMNYQNLRLKEDSKIRKLI